MVCVCVWRGKAAMMCVCGEKRKESALRWVGNFQPYHPPVREGLRSPSSSSNCAGSSGFRAPESGCSGRQTKARAALSHLPRPA